LYRTPENLRFIDTGNLNGREAILYGKRQRSANESDTDDRYAPKWKRC